MGTVMSAFDVPSGETAQDQIPGALAAASHRICSAMHATVRATPVQLAFGQDSTLNVQHTHMEDWKCMQSHKQNAMVKNNVCENSKRKDHAHDLNKLALVKRDWSSEFGTTSCDGPCPITKINDDGAVQVQMNNACDTINL